MPGHDAPPCPHFEVTLSLAHDQLEGEARRAAVTHLEGCDACRAQFARETADWLPSFPNYTIVERIGRGGFGEVYRAIHHTKQRTEALKVLSEGTQLRSEYFRNEVHLVAKLRHPNIVTLYEANLAEPPAYYAMEFVEGMQLDPYLAQRDASLEERLALVRAIAEAMGYAHAQGVVHRDLKPQNVLVDTDGQPHIVDFGIAKWLRRDDPDEAGAEGATHEGAIGTYGYIAPEQVRGDDVDARADIYGLGALLFHLVSGHPARRVTETDRLARVLKRRGCARPADLAAIIMRCVERWPEQRYQNTAQLILDLDNYTAGRPVAARRDAPPFYHAKRAIAVAVRTAPLAIIVLIVSLLTMLFSMSAHAAAARWFVHGSANTFTELVALTPDIWPALANGEVDANSPGLRPLNRKSWRVLHGRLLERLAVAAPRVVVWDFYAPDCQPEYDEALLRGIEALPCPFILGAHTLSIDGEPIACERIRAAATNVGVLAAPRPLLSLDEFETTLCMQRGRNPTWTPSLAIAAYAAARFPESQAFVEVAEGRVELRYRRRTADAARPPGVWKSTRSRFMNVTRLRRPHRRSRPAACRCSRLAMCSSSAIPEDRRTVFRPRVDAPSETCSPPTRRSSALGSPTAWS